MKVKDLISKLQKYPEDLDVLLGVNDWLSEPSDLGAAYLKLGVWDDSCEYQCKDTNDENEANCVVIVASI